MPQRGLGVGGVDLCHPGYVSRMEASPDKSDLSDAERPPLPRPLVGASGSVA